MWLRGCRGREALATAVYCIVLDATELERELGQDFLGLHTPYRMPEKLATIGVTHLGEERIRTLLVQPWPTQFLTRSWHYLHSSQEAW